MSVKQGNGAGTFMGNRKQSRHSLDRRGRNKRSGRGKLAKSIQENKRTQIKGWGTPKMSKVRIKKSAPKRNAVVPRQKGATAASGGKLAARFFSPEGLVNIDDVAQSFGLSKGRLAETVGVRPETLQRFSRAFAPKTQNRLKEMLEIVGRVADWAGGKDQAMAWYRAEPIPAFGGRTAESLVKDGKAVAVRDYLDHVALGGFA
jgi:hypothetical protein